MPDNFPSLPEILEGKIEMILSWADERPDFDTGFVESLKAQLEDKGSLTGKQIDALNRIIEKFEIDC